MSKGEANVENKDSYVIVNVDPKRVNDFKSKDSSQFKKLYSDYAKKKYNIGTVDCFTFAMDFLNNRLKGDLKQKPHGESNDERFEDLKKDRN